MAENKFFKSSEEVVSMILGLLIVVVISGLVVNYFQKNRGKIDIPGVITENKKVEPKTTESLKLPTTEIAAEGKYVVKSGDSLWKIATVQLGSGFRWQEIAKLNNLNNPSVLKAGQTLSIPEKTQLTAAKNDNEKAQLNMSKTYTVVRGDSLWKIAVRTYGDGFRWVEIYRANKNVIRQPGLLRAGMKLVMPPSK